MLLYLSSEVMNFEWTEVYVSGQLKKVHFVYLGIWVA